MSKGITKVIYEGAAAQVMVDDVPNWGFIYEASTVRNPKFRVGDRVILPDGRVYRYSYAAATCDSQCGAYNGTKTFAVAVAPAQASVYVNGLLTSVGQIGDSLVKMTVASGGGILGTGVVAEDELRGGYVVVGNGSAQSPQMRGIIGNTAVAATGGSCTLFLDAPLIAAVTVGTTTIETYVNPYGYLTGGLTTPSDYVTFIGVPTVKATVGQYFWLQTWGICWITSDGNTCDSARDRTIVFVGNGSVKSSNDETLESGLQIAGVAFDTSSSSASNAPMCMLQISI